MFGLFKTIIADLPPKKRTFLGFILSWMFNHPFKLMVNIRLGQRFSKSKIPFLRLYSRFYKRRKLSQMFYLASNKFTFNMIIN